jgi:hypothetical protein
MVKVLGYSVYLSCSLKVVLGLPIQGCQGVNNFYYVARMNGQISGRQIINNLSSNTNYLIKIYAKGTGC